MNERIKLLAEQAGFIPDNAPGMNSVLEKFAELIVKECADLFEVEYGESVASGNEVARVMKRHFGVK